MNDMDRELTVLADGQPFAVGAMLFLYGKLTIGLFPSLFTLRARNLSEKEIFRLMNTRHLVVLHGGSCLAYGAVSDVFSQTDELGTLTTAAFSLGLDLWEAQVSLSLEAGMSIRDTVDRILHASGTGISLLTWSGWDADTVRGQAFFGRAADCISTALTGMGARAYLVPAGLCIIPEEPLPATLHLTAVDLTDRPVLADGGKKLILSTTVTGFQPGEEMTLEYDGIQYTGLILERMVEADNWSGPWVTQLLVELH